MIFLVTQGGDFSTCGDRIPAIFWNEITGLHIFSNIDETKLKLMIFGTNPDDPEYFDQ